MSYPGLTISKESFEQRRGFLAVLKEHPELIQTLTRKQQIQLKHDWYVWARDNQLEEYVDNKRWNHWLALCGRGFGKTKLGAEWTRKQMLSGNMRRMSLIARTPEEARKVMVEGESGIMEVCSPSERPIYEPANKRLLWKNGGICNIFSGEKPDGLRGHQCDGYWADEIAAWRFPQETWDMLKLGFRLESRDGRPRGIITTTPRPIELIKKLVAQSKAEGNMGKVYVLKASSRENFANLSEVMRDSVMELDGTRLGRQEIDADILDDAPGALWTRSVIKTVPYGKLPSLVEIAIGVDPQKVSKKKGGESSEKERKNCVTGIIVGGRDAVNQGYALGDYSVDGKPEIWGQCVVDAYREFKADVVVAEVNQGGDMVEAVIHSIDPNIPVRMVNASRGETKYARAQPIALRYIRNQIFHWGNLPLLEDQLCTWDPALGESPDRLDALVWCMWHLLLNRGWDDGDRSIVGLGRRGW